MKRAIQSLLSKVSQVGQKVGHDYSHSKLRWPIDSTSGLPYGRYFATLGELAENYGGTANVIFHRSKAIVEQTGTPVEILTFGYLRDYKALTEEFLGDGRFVPGLRFRNMWDEIAIIPHGEGGEDASSFSAFEPLNMASTSTVEYGVGVPIRRFRKDEKGRNLQIDFCRADGSVIVTYRRDTVAAESKRRESIILCNMAGAPIEEFESFSQLRSYWLDVLIGTDFAIMFSDTFGVAGFTHTYRRANVIVVQTFHNRHLAHTAHSQLGFTEMRYLPFLDNIDDFDATIFLTQRQKRDIDILMGRSRQRWVVPNSRSIGNVEPRLQRDRNRFVTVGRLVAGKQFDHAIRAVVGASRHLPVQPNLHMYGEGSARPALEKLIAELGASSIKLQGYDSRAPEKFAGASVSFLTSRSEAMPLVLVESMARGCIPIAYDIDYGPGEVITNGVDGFLVPPNDLEALERTIVQVQNMEEQELESMRVHAIARAQDFSDAAIVANWGQLLRATSARKRVPEELGIADFHTTMAREETGLRLVVEFTTNRPLIEPIAHVVLKGRGMPVITRVEGDVEDLSEERYRVSSHIEVDRVSWVKEGIIDLQLEIHDLAGRGVKRFTGLNDHLIGDLRLGEFVPYSTKYGNLSFKHD